MSRADRAEAYFLSHPDQWIHWTVFASLCGSLAWRTRISDCRKRGLHIVNRLDRDSQGFVHSYYRFVRPSL